MRTRTIPLIILSLLSLAVGCRRDDDEPTPVGPSGQGGGSGTGTPTEVAIPANFPPMPIPADNPFTVEGIALGRYLFYEELLSGNNTMSVL